MTSTKDHGFAPVSLAELNDDPHAVHERLRGLGPVVHVDAIGGWLILGRAEALAAMRDPSTFTVDDPRFSTAQIIGPSMLSLDGAEHQRHRTPFVAPYLPAAVREHLGEWTEARANELVDSIADSGHAELRTEIAGPLAASVIRQSLGLVDTSVDELLDAYRSISRTVHDISTGAIEASAVATSDGAAAYRRLEATFIATAAQIPDSPLAGAAEALLPSEMASNAAVVLFGAIETSEAATANTFHYLLSTPGALQLVRRDRSLVPAAVEESLRLEPPAASIDRYTTRDVTLGGVTMAKGDFVSVSLAAANRDPLHYSDPHRYMADRADGPKHVTFASGPHACLGAHVARLQTGAAVQALLDLPGNVRLDESASSPPQGLIFRKPPAITASW